MKGIIYKIVCNETGEVYYGSTQQSLNKRIAIHVSKCKGWKAGNYHYTTSFSIIERGNYSYSLIETVECQDRQQLETRERFYIEKNECANKVIPTRTQKEWQEQYKTQRNIYNQVNRDHINELHRQQYHNNKDKVNEKLRQKRAKQKELNLLQQAHQNLP